MGEKTEKLLRIKQVLELVPVGRSSWWAGVASGRYPRPTKLGPRTSCWKLSEIERIVRGEG